MIVISSTMGFRPAIAAPMPAPTMTDSAIGVSFTRFVAELFEEALRDGVGAAVGADVLAHEEDALVVLELLAQRLAERLAVGDLRHRAGSL